jgi:hypothetical protein
METKEITLDALKKDGWVETNNPIWPLQKDLTKYEEEFLTQLTV